MTRRRYSICMNIEGFLRTERAKGHKVIPCSGECGNPCKQPGCKGFDYTGGGCPGYEITDEEMPA